MWSEKTAGRAEHVRPQHRPDAGAGQRHRALRRRGQHRVGQPGRRPDPRGQRASRSARGSARSRSPGTLRIADNTTVRAGTFELNWKIGLGAIWIYALEKDIDADIQVTGDTLPRQHLQRDHAGHRLPGEGPVLDQRTCTSRTSRRRHRHLGAQRPVGGSASFQNVDARNVGAVGVNNCGSFNFPADGLGVLADRPRRQRRRHHRRGWRRGSCPNTITCDDRPPVVPPPPPAGW